jgi:Fe-S-cluster containining protein
MQEYRKLLQDVDHWFSHILTSHAGRMQCRQGCALCCYGLFDISLPDAVVAAEGMLALPHAVREQVWARAVRLQDVILRQVPELNPPYVLDGPDNEGIDRIVEAADNPRCPFLGEQDQCLIYEHRPLACRLEGAPMVDARDGLFGDWCELNFTGGVSEEARRTLVLDYAGIQELEYSLTEGLAAGLLGRPAGGVTVFIPSLIAEFESFWRPRLDTLTRAKFAVLP